MSQTDPAVVAFITALDHPQKAALERVRRLVLAADPSISEGIKWNAPSFRTSDWFLTFHLKGKGTQERLWLIFHTGAKVKASATGGITVEDPGSLLEWLAKDRAKVVFEGLGDVNARAEALTTLVRSWIRSV